MAFDSKEIYDELVDEITNINKKYGLSNVDNFPTAKWVAGKFQQLDRVSSLQSSLDSGTVDDPERAAEYERIIKLKDIALKYKLVKKETTRSGGTDYKKTDNGSKFIQKLSSSFASWKDQKTRLREISTVENEEWYNNLSSEDKNLVDTYSQLTAKDYAFLMGLIDKQKDKQNYTNSVAFIAEHNPEKFEKLQSLKLINSDYTINLPFIRSLLNFINDKTYARLKSFNKDISYITDRISADRALVNNYLERNIDRSSFRRSDLAKHADNLLDDLDDYDKTTIMAKYKGGNIRGQINPKLVSDKIIDTDGSLTELGRYIAVIISKLDRNPELKDRGEKPTQYSRLSRTDSATEENISSRKQEKASSRNTSFKNFLSSRK